MLPEAAVLPVKQLQTSMLEKEASIIFLSSVEYFLNYFNVKFKGKVSSVRRSSLLYVCSEITTEDCATPEPMSPDDVEVEVNYEPDPTDLVLSSVPGGELFDPRKHKFSEDELKPQPMIKKAKKVFVPEEQKVCDG